MVTQHFDGELGILMGGLITLGLQMSRVVVIFVLQRKVLVRHSYCKFDNSPMQLHLVVCWGDEVIIFIVCQNDLAVMGLGVNDSTKLFLSSLIATLPSLHCKGAIIRRLNTLMTLL